MPWITYKMARDEAWNNTAWVFSIIVVLHFSTVISHLLGNTGDFPLKTVDQCYGHQIPIICPEGSLVQIDKAYYRQAPYCPGDFHNNFCNKEETSNPACIGNQTCIFTTPWVYLSKQCGYSNNFMVNYFCVPVAAVSNICQERIVHATTGYIASPDYPSKYPTSLNCAIQILAPRGYRLSIYQLDLYLSYYNFNSRIRCIDRLWITDGSKSTGYLCSSQRRSQVFSTRGNKALIKFITSPHFFKNTKGFWLYFEATPITTPATVVQQRKTTPWIPNTTIKPVTVSHSITTATEKPINATKQSAPNKSSGIMTMPSLGNKTATYVRQIQHPNMIMNTLQGIQTRNKIHNGQAGIQPQRFPRNYFKFRKFHSKETMQGQPRSKHFRKHPWQNWLPFPKRPRWNINRKTRNRNILNETKKLNDVSTHIPVRKPTTTLISESADVPELKQPRLNETSDLHQLTPSSGIYETTSTIANTIPGSNKIDSSNESTTRFQTAKVNISMDNFSRLTVKEWSSLNKLLPKTDLRMYGPPSVSSTGNTFPDYDFEKWFFKQLFGLNLPFLRKSAETTPNMPDSLNSNALNTNSTIAGNETVIQKDDYKSEVSQTKFYTTSGTDHQATEQTNTLIETADTTLTNREANTFTSSHSPALITVASSDLASGLKVLNFSINQNETEDYSNNSEHALTMISVATTSRSTNQSTDTFTTTNTPLNQDHKKIHETETDFPSDKRDYLETKKKLNTSLKDQEHFYRNKYLQRKNSNLYGKPLRPPKENNYIKNYRDFKEQYGHRINYRNNKPTYLRRYYNKFILPHQTLKKENIPKKDQLKTYRNTNIHPFQAVKPEQRSQNHSLPLGDTKVNKTKSKTQKPSSPLAQAERHPKLRLGTKEFSGIVGGSASLVLLILIAGLVISFHKRCHKSYRKKRRRFPQSRKKKFNDIILAYESSEGDTSPHSLSSISNISFNDDRTFPHLHTTMPYTGGDINCSFDNQGHKRSLLDHMDLLKTIDERPEDIYSHFKHTKPKWFKKKLNKQPKKSPKKYISKSADNLSDLYPSLERRLSISGTKNNKNLHCSMKSNTLLSFSKGVTMDTVTKHRSDKARPNLEVAKLTDNMDDGLYSDVAAAFPKANATCNASQQTPESFLKKSQSEPDIFLKSKDICDNLQQDSRSTLENSDDENTGMSDGEVLKKSKSLQVHKAQGEDDTLDTDNMSSIIDFTSPNSEKGNNNIQSDESGEMPSTFTHVTEYENPEGHYSSLDEAHKYLWDKRVESPYEPVYQQIPDYEDQVVTLTSFTSTGEDTEHDISDSKGNFYENAKDHETLKCVENATHHVKNNLDVKYKEKDYVSVSFTEDRPNRTKKSRSHDKHNKRKSSKQHQSSDNSKYGKNKHTRSHKTKETFRDETQCRYETQIKSEDDRSSFDSLRKSREYHKQKQQDHIQSGSGIKDSAKAKPRYTTNTKTGHTRQHSVHASPNQQILDLLEQNGDINKATLLKMFTNNPDCSHIDLSTMNSQNELTSESLDLSFHRAKQQEFPPLTHQNIVQILSQHYQGDHTISLPKKHVKRLKRSSSSGGDDKVRLDGKSYTTVERKHSDIADITCSPYSTIKTINSSTPYEKHGIQKPVQESQQESLLGSVMQKHEFLPNGFFMSKHMPATYNGQNNWRNTPSSRNNNLEAVKKATNLPSRHGKKNNHSSDTNNLSISSEAPAKHFLLCSSESPEDFSKSACIHSNASSQRSRKSHATLYSDITDIEGIYMPKSIAHSHGDVSL